MEETVLQEKTKVVLFAADCGEYDMERSISELTALCESAGYEVAGEVVQKRDKPDNAAFLGEGRLYEGKLVCENLGARLAVVDAELTGVQIKNMENALDVDVIDRTMLILDIFASRAVTNEGKLQVELARLKYRLPRLAGLGTQLSRQGGGGGGTGGARRGAGESKLEYDRRYIRSRIDLLSEKLDEIEKRRAETRKNREKNSVPVIALVGYTNVGKSSLLNRLCGSEVMEKDMLFATLDPTARKFIMPSGQNVIFVDTVGFVSRLPHNLVEAFKSTLEEAKYADIIIKVCNLADNDSYEQLEVTDEVLARLGCGETPQITVYNQCDLIENALMADSSALKVSAKTGEGIDNLLQALDTMLADRIVKIEAVIPYDKMQLVAAMRADGTVETEEYRENGVYVKGFVKKTKAYIYSDYNGAE